MPKGSYITASRFADVMTRGKGTEFGAVATKYAIELIHAEYGIYKEQVSAPSLEWGNEYEPIAIAEYESDQFVTVHSKQDFIEHPDIAGVGFHPDGLIGSDGVLEVKCPYDFMNHYLNWTECAQYSDYQYQIQGALWITGREWCDFVSFYPHKPNCPIPSLVRWRIYREEETISNLSERIVKFKQFMEEIKPEGLK